MANRAQFYEQMAARTAEQITGSYQEWTAFLATAARLYKYPYHEQLMIYAQRPEATACAEYDFWNKRMRRYVRRGSRGIALVDSSGEKPSLRYVFDVADTGGGDNARRPYLWQLQDEHMDTVLRALEARYEVSGANGLEYQLELVADRLAKDYWEDHQRDILGIIEDSFLEEYDDYNVGASFRSAASTSITYTLMARCGLDPEQYFGHEDFLSVFDWNTPAAVSALGTAVSEVSEQVLRHIEVTIKRYEREKITERSQNHGERADLHTERGLSDPGPEADGGAGGGTAGQVREDAQAASEGAPAHPVSEAGAGGEAVPAPAGDRRDGPPASVRDDAADGEGGGRDGGVESSRPNEVGGPDEHPESAGGGDHPERAGIQLTGQEQQLTLFPSEQEQRQSIAEAESVETPSAFSISDAEWDAELRRGSGNLDGKLRIYALFLGMPDTKAAVAFLKQEYGSFYSHSQTYQDGSHGTVIYTTKDIEFRRYQPGGSIHIPWSRAAARLKELASAQDYFTPVEKGRWDAIVRGFQQRGEPLPPPVPRAPYPPPMQPEQLTLDALTTPPAAETVSPPPASPPPFHEKYLPEILRHEDGSATWEALTKFFADHPEEHLRVSYLRLRFGEVLHQYPASDGTSIGFRGFPDQFHVWEGNYLNPTAITRLTWGEVCLLAEKEIARDKEQAIPAHEAEAGADEARTPDSPEVPHQPEIPTTDRHGALTQADIDAALRDWNGDMESKRAVVRYMKEHGREKDTAAWLAQEYGGSNSNSLFVVRAGSPEETQLPWPKVQRRLAQLIQEDRFYTEEEQDRFDNIDPIAIREALEERGIVNGQVADPEKLDNDPFIQQVRSDAEQIADAETEQTSEVSISDEEYDAVRRPIPQRTSYDPAAPVYAVGDTVYIEDDAYQITELREDTVQLLPTGMVYPIYRAERKEQFEQLLRADRRNAYYTEFLPIDPDKADQDLRDVLAHGLMDEADKKQISTLLQSGRSNSEIAYWLSRAYSGEIETLNLETGDIADYRTTAQGMELEVLDAEEKRLAVLYFRWDEVAPLLRGMYARQQDGFGQEQPQPATESPTFHSETMAVYPGDKNNLPYDVVVERLHIEEPEPPAPVTEPEKTFEEVLDEHPVSIQVNGQWQTFPNAKAAEEASYEEYKANLRRNAKNFRITDEHLGEGGPKAKFQANINAIRLLKELEAAGQQASPEQQEVLSRYVGWGGLSDAFDPEKPAWALEYAQLKELLTPEEYAAARSSTLNAHYTSPTVIQAIYEAVGRMGFETGNILEPSMGVGNFFGMLPEEMRNSRLYGVELDPVSGRIAKQLYPKADITVGGFETTDRRDFFDLAIGNVPFGQYQVNDKAYNKLNFSIHNYFFAKALDQVRPGGVVAFVTSRYTMDAKDSTVRRYLAQRAELLGAIRLPNDAFKKNAGAEVVSDIIFLQKRDRPLDIVPEWTQIGQTEDGFAINRYFIDHPEMVLGRQEPVSTAHGMDYTVNPIEGLELSDQLHDAVKYIHGTYQEAELPELGEGETIDTSIPADPNVKNYSYAIVDGQVYYRENSRMVRPDLNATAEARVKGLVGLRDCVQELIDLQMDAAVPDSTIREKQAELNSLYDSFSAKYGLINDRANRLAYADDSSYYLLCALEVIDEDGKLERKADMFTKRTIKPHQAVAVVDTASEALAVSISEKACVDMDYMSQLTGKTKEELAGELQGVIFRVPGQLEQDGTPHYVTADEYLSGNVRRKLRQAQRAAQQDPVYAVNVEALTAAQPKDLDASEIEVRLGATWIDKEYIQQFMYETFNTPFYLQRSIEVNYSSFTAEWQIKGKSSVSYNDVAAYTTYGTSRANAYKILEDSLNLRDVRIYDTIEDADGKERRVLNAKETTLAAQKQQAIREAFRDWIWRDPERRQTLVRQYNEEMNSTRPREYDGSHITFGGMNPAITLREHQKSAIAHVLYGGNTLLAHEVGAGKTFEMVAASMEAKRLGLCQKSLFVVPNHLTEQWASEFLRLYPSANILVTTKKDFETHNRKKFCARIATGDYDAIIMGHSQFERIPISRERQERLLYEQIDEITEGIAEVQASGGERFTVKQLERTRKSLEARLEKLQAEGRKDDVVTFEQLGVDRLFVDEAHNYKNLFLYTKMRNVAGLSTSDAQKSSDMFAKCRYMDEITGNRGVIFATGTPVSNSMTELYTMQRYLQYERLQELNMTHFDCWASRFGETVTALELAPEGTGYRARTRFSKFFNLPELMNLFKEVADIKTADQLNLPTPEVEYHNIVAQPTEHQQEMVKALSERASLVHSGTVDPSQDNMLKITSDGRKLGLDQRIVNQMLPDEPGTKVNQCVDNIMQIWRDGKADKLTQLVFCDISTPQAKAPASKAAKTLDNPLLHALEGSVPLPEQEPAFTVYDDIRQKLIAQGMPADQIAFIHEANTEVRKKELFSKVRTGQVRVLLGSTAKMGAGTNVQDRLVALHDLDCPWRPGDVGRILRTFKIKKNVEVTDNGKIII